jgi:hypothetical protein
VLTAAHCITESPTIGRLEILAGKWNLAASEPTQQGMRKKRTKKIQKTNI